MVMTYPHIGNYGVIPGDEESRRVWVEAFIVKEVSRRHSNFRANEDLESYLERQAFPESKASIRARSRATSETPARSRRCSPPPIWTKRASSRAPSRVPASTGATWCATSPAMPRTRTASARAARSAWRMTWGRRTTFSANWAGGSISKSFRRPNPQRACCEKARRRFLIERPGGSGGARLRRREREKHHGPGARRGHLSRAPDPRAGPGRRTYKLKFGHHGANHPVQDLSTKKVDITSQNHSFAVDPESLPAGVAVTHSSLNDNTCEGLKSESPKVFSVQYTPRPVPARTMRARCSMRSSASAWGVGGARGCCRDRPPCLSCPPWLSFVRTGTEACPYGEQFDNWEARHSRGC